MKAAAIALSLCLVASLAQAETPKQRAAAAFAEGQKLFKKKDYAQAAERFQAAYAADEDPVYLFNAATALRLAKQCTPSRDLYKKFLTVAPNVPNRDKVEKSLAEVEDCAAKEKPIEKPVEKPVEKPIEKPIEKPVEKAGERPEPMEKPIAPPPDPGRGRRRLGWISIAGGAVALGVGGFFVTRVSAAERDREALCPAPCAWNEDLEAQEADLDARGKRAQTIAFASLAVGGAAIATGIVLVVTGRSSSERVAITPAPAGAIVHTGFRF